MYNLYSNQMIFKIFTHIHYAQAYDISNIQVPPLTLLIQGISRDILKLSPSLTTLKFYHMTRLSYCAWWRHGVDFLHYLTFVTEIQ